MLHTLILGTPGAGLLQILSHGDPMLLYLKTLVSLSLSPLGLGLVEGTNN